MRRQIVTMIILFVPLLMAGCRERADSFFSGRPSEMAMLHNRIISGPPEAMLELLRVPSRFPDATGAHIAAWQDSITAWWRNAEKHETLAASFGKLSQEETRAALGWVRTREHSGPKDKSQALTEIESALNAARPPS